MKFIKGSRSWAKGIGVELVWDKCQWGYYVNLKFRFGDRTYIIAQNIFLSRKK